ncbi:MAG: hypothetical protein WC761_00375 [Candidatus Paceibacterota bacterium]|jgi:hypothetical protein
MSPPQPFAEEIRELKARWTLEMAQDLYNFYNVATGSAVTLNPPPSDPWLTVDTFGKSRRENWIAPAKVAHTEKQSNVFSIGEILVLREEINIFYMPKLIKHAKVASPDACPYTTYSSCTGAKRKGSAGDTIFITGETIIGYEGGWNVTWYKQVSGIFTKNSDGVGEEVYPCSFFVDLPLTEEGRQKLRSYVLTFPSVI